ncbi:InlB B-repeat-containing protein [Rhodococcus sp. IEGM 1408]|uniref:InlB B-repeat-containing protein n=1 Tax=Rhodococcus sp. IEGM 1408 TaxID=3082220 RepID=UPI00295535FE|nr:InlB B-repeat-containing protein [Rhodococcus sp. IEGM 1408]MDV8002207.1 InlB B-repeat-containing protein [Rhodococcus sp. IEGM 1408]
MSTLFLPATVTVRRYLAFFLALLLAATVLVIASAAPARADIEQAVIVGVAYTVDTADVGAGATVTGYNADSGPVVDIPSTVEVGGAEYAVTAIGDDAFYSKGLTSVTLPDTLVTIGHLAFSRNRLTSVTLPDGLVTLGGAAFMFNDLLTSVTLPDGLSDIGDFTFYENRLTSVILPSNLVTIGEGAFAFNHLTSVVIPAGVTTIDLGAFHTNHYLSQVRFTGPAPTTITGTGSPYPPLGNAAGLTVTFPAQYLAQPQGPGYTSPQWMGYNAHPDSYTVSFDTSGGAVIDPVSVAHGGLLDLPSVPVREGYTFTNWSTSPESDVLFSPTLPITGSQTLYAGWQQNTHTVSFDTGGGAVIEPVIVSHGGLLELPAVPVREGYTFTGWNTAPELDTPFDSELPITESLTLYAGWKLNDVPALPVTPGWVSSVSGSLGSLALSSPVT